MLAVIALRVSRGAAVDQCAMRSAGELRFLVPQNIIWRRAPLRAHRPHQCVLGAGVARRQNLYTCPPSWSVPALRAYRTVYDGRMVRSVLVRYRSTVASDGADTVPRAGSDNPWRQPQFRWFYSGQLASMLGSATAPVALAFAVLNASGSTADLSLVLAAHSLPLLLFLLVGGAVADRFSKSLMLTFSNVGAGITQSLAATLLITHNYSLGALLVLEAFNGVFSAFTMPALRGVLPSLVRTTALQRANSALSSARNAAKVLGPTAGGLVVAGVGGGWAVAFDAATFVIAAACTVRLKIPAQPTAVSSNLITDIRQGWREFAGLRWVVAITSTFAVTNCIFAGIWGVLGPGIAHRTVGSAAWGLVLSARGVGMLATSGVMYRIRFGHLLRVGQLAAAGGAVPMITLGLNVGPVWLIAGAFLAGVGSSINSIAWDTSLQEHVRRSALSRVSSYDNLGSTIAVPLGQVAVAPLAAAFGAGPVAVGGGLVYLVVMLSSLGLPEVGNLKHARTPETAAVS
jgi:MFS family permease